MTVLLQISDPHFGTERADVVAALEAFAAPLAPDLLLLTGDITQRATAAQFAAARAFVDRLAVRAVLAIPGNHDIPLFHLPTRVFAPYSRYARAFGDDLEPSFEADDAIVIGLNTTRAHRHKDGEVSEAQVERVARRLESAGRSQWRIVLVHQPVAVNLVADLKNRLHGRDRAVRRWSEAGADLIVGGHIHLPFVIPLHEAAERAGDRPLPRPIWAVQAGTATSRRVRPESPANSINVIRIEGPRIVIERFDCIDPRRGFEFERSQTIPAASALRTLPSASPSASSTP